MKAMLFLAAGAALLFSAHADPIKTLPISEKNGAQSLNGDWSFKYLPSLDAGADAAFSQPAFDVSSWKTIPVPANWELCGFAEPRYEDDLPDGLGLYRRTFQVPSEWRSRGQRVALRFEGVLYGFEAWVNGTRVGESSASGYNPNTFDITDALKPGENVLAVKVTTKPLGWEFDVNDDWDLSGIYRDVTVFPLPATHLQDLATSTHLAPDGTAELSVKVSTNQPEGEIHGKLIAPTGATVSEFALPRGTDGVAEAVVKVSRPQLWTAETPELYRLELTLSSQGGSLQNFETRIGLREISIAEGVLLLNGRPIKLHGVNHHDLSPEHGRAITETEMREDLDLMRKANINYIRTSHYPPQPRFLDLCDEMGFYVICEVPIGKGEEHLNDPAYRANLLGRTDATITRDRNHASVLIWSIGNENPITDVELEASRRAKELDPSRPICIPKVGSYFAKNYQRLPEYVDIYAPHYPDSTTLRGYAQKLTRPLILTEYAHGLGLATDRVQTQWEILQHTPRFAGGSVWMFQDQGILRTSDQAVDRTKPTEAVWRDPHHYYDGCGDKGVDGIVYADRTPQADYWEVRQVYAPVQIEAESTAVKEGRQEIPLTVENRYDFRPLTGLKLAWTLLRNGAKAQSGEIPLTAPAREKETVRVPIEIPQGAAADIWTLELRGINEAGESISERGLKLSLEGADRFAWLRDLPAGSPPKVTSTESEITIELPSWALKASRSTGEVTIRDRSGHLLVAGLFPHCGRRFTMAERLSAAKGNTWSPSILTVPSLVEVKVEQDKDVVRLTVSGTYPRPDQPEQSLVGGYEAAIASTGAVTIHYEYTPTKAQGHFAEAGLSLVLPEDITEFRWIGAGPYPGYPGKDRLNEFGLFHLNRDDLRFQGNRRETELAVLTTPDRAGVALSTDPADVSVERAGCQTLLSHNAVISGLGNKGVSAETFLNAAKTSSISGTFVLLPLPGKWPAALARWFSTPREEGKIFHPFYYSYDQ